MASRQPLVLVDGRVRQLPSGDTLQVDLTLTAGQNLAPRQVVYIRRTGGVPGRAYLAQANANTTADFAFIAGMTLESALTGNAVKVRFAGFVPGFTGLTPGEWYWLHKDIAGAVTTTQSGRKRLIGVATDSTTIFLQPMGVSSP